MVKFTPRNQNQNQQEQAQDPQGDTQSGASAHNGRPFRMDSVAEPMAKYLTLAASLTSQLGGGLKSRASRPPELQLALDRPQFDALSRWSAAERRVPSQDEAKDQVGPLVVAKSPVASQQQQQQVAPQAAAVVASALSKGRPLNRVAMSRAKFAIRSYTIAVSTCMCDRA